MPIQVQYAGADEAVVVRVQRPSWQQFISY